MQAFNPRLHGMRALAAVGVLLFHWAQLFPMVQQTLYPGSTDYSLRWHLSFFIGFGWMGVPLFFVLSGYLLTGVIHTAKYSIGSFWRRRFLRIYPAVWLQVAAFAALGTSIAGLPEIHANLRGITNTLLYINLPPMMSKPINPVWWTLPIELGFYLLLPFIVLLSKRAHWLLLTAIGIAITLIWRWVAIALIDEPPFYRHLAILDALPGFLTPFMLGFALAHAPTLSARWRWLVLSVALAAGYGLLLAINTHLNEYWQGGAMLILWPSLLALCIAGAIWATATPLRGFGWLGSRPMVWFGHLSFGIYLWHYPCFQVIKHNFPAASESFSGSALALLAASIATLILAALSYYCLERPIMGWRKRVNTPSEASGQPPAPDSGTLPNNVSQTRSR